MTVVIIVLSLFVIFDESVVFGYQTDFDLIDSIKQETQCSKAGGMCVIRADCPLGSLTPERGLCPLQKRKGVECCYGRSVKDTRCQKMGICRPKTEFCNPRLVIPATDCPLDTRCCVLV